MIAFTPKNWHNTPSASTPISASALEDLETRVTDHANTQVAVIGETVDLDTSGATDEASALQTAIDNVQSQGGGVVLLPATNYSSGYIKIGSLIDIPQAVCLRGQGQRETRLLCSAAGAGLRFNYYDGVTTNTRGGECGGFHIDGNNTATTVMKVDKAANRSFSDFRSSRPGANGISLLVETAQNCNFDRFDLEATRATSNTTGIKVTESAGSCRFSRFSLNEYSYADVHITQDTAGGQKGVSYPEPRYCSFDDGIIERGDCSTAVGIRIHSARDLWFSRLVLSLGVGDTVSSDYPLVEIDDSGAGATRQIYFDRGGSGGNTSPAKHSIAFDVQSGAADYYTRITNWQFGNNTIGVQAASGQTVELDAYNNTSTTTLTSGSGTFNKRAMGASTYSS